MNPLVSAAAVGELVAAIHAILPEPAPGDPVGGLDMVRTVTDGLLRRGVDELTLTGAAVLLRDAPAKGLAVAA